MSERKCPRCNGDRTIEELRLGAWLSDHDGKWRIWCPICKGTGEAKEAERGRE